MKRFQSTVYGLAILSLVTHEAGGQAFCALRDPVTHIYQAYPTADSYRSIVRTVTEEVREKVGSELPFTIHFNELGRHTLYVPTQNSKPLGLLHVRSEKGAWGLVEIAWSFDVSMRIRHFSFQRCRSRQRKLIESDEFRKQILGKNMNELRALLNADGTALAPNGIRVTPQADKLATTVVRSAIKTLSVTQHAWSMDLDMLRILNHAYTAFPEASKIAQIQDVYSDDVLRNLELHLQSKGSSAISRDGVLALRVLDDDDNTVGHVYRTPWKSLNYRVTLWWNISSDLTIKEVIPEGDWPDQDVAMSFRQAQGTSFQDIHQCSTAVQMIGAELLILSQTHAK